MKPYKENLISRESPFPVDAFISENVKEHIDVNPHWHECIEILYMLEGTAIQQVNDRYFSVDRHDLIILNQGDIHSTVCERGDNVKILVVKFLPDVLGNIHSSIFESKYILVFLNNRRNQVYHIADTIKNSTEIHYLMMGIYKEFVNQDTGYEIFIKGYIYQLIACLIRNDILNIYQPLIKERELEKLDGLLKYIESHYKEDINLEKAANILNLSYYYASRFFKRVTGSSFKEYLDFVRICEAEKLLLSSNMSISQVAYEVGFSNVSSFNRVFKRVRDFCPGSIKRAKTAKK